MSYPRDLPLKQAIEEMLRDYRLEDKFTEVKIQAAWQKIVGNIVFKHTKALYLRNGILYLVLTSAALKQEISYSKTKIIEKLNRKLGNAIVKEIIIK